MSLKALVQLFAEKFLVSKKSWVSNQSQALISGGTDISYTSTTDTQTFIAPSDGVICLNVYGAEWAKLDSTTNLRGILLHSPLDKTAWKTLFLPVAKGKTARINLSLDKKDTTIKFIPTIGS